MAVAFSLIPELEDVVEHGSDEKRAETLRRLTTLFVEGAPRFNDDHVRLFDEIFVALIAEIESRVRAELAERLAPIGNAPAETIRRLAKDDDILVAGPVLTQSKRLATSDLVDIASSMGPEHLFAISSRPEIEEPVTDILARRGDFTVRRKLAGNAGARISESGFAILARNAEHDLELAEAIAQRPDIPDHIFRNLLARATAVVQQRLLARARPETQAEIRRVLANVSGEVARRQVRDFAAARQKVREMALAGELDESKLASLARTRAYDDTVAALSALTQVPIEVVDRLMNSARPDPILILCKAAGYSWPTTRDLILARLGSRGKAAVTIDEASTNFDRLSAETARRVVRFWQITPSAGLRAAG